MVELVAISVASFILSKIAASLLAKDPKTPLVDNKPNSPSTRGSRIPILVGRRRVGPNVVWVGDRNSNLEAASGGKGGAPSGEQLVYKESAHHVLCVGPGHGLHRIWSNGKVIFNPLGGISPLSHPSGTSISTEIGPFTIYWGEQDSPEDEFLAGSTRMGIRSKWKFCMRVVWVQARLGGFPTWPAIEYEPEVRPYKAGDTISIAYSSLPERLSGSLGWLDNEPGLSGISYLIRDAFSHIESPPRGKFIIQSNQTAFFVAGNKLKITGNSTEFANRLLTIESSTYDAGVASYSAGSNTTNTLPAPTTASWTRTGVTVSLVTDLTNPFSSIVHEVALSGVPVETLSWNTNQTSVGGAFLLGPIAAQISVDIKDFKTVGRRDITFSLRPFLGGVSNTHSARVQWIPATGFTISSTADVSLSVQTIVPGTVEEPDTWHRFVLYYAVGHGSPASLSTYTAALTLDLSACSTSVRITRPLVIITAGTLLAGGTTTVKTVETLFNPLFASGQLLPYVIGSGPGGPNAAHVVHQLMFESHPHGVGLDPADFDIPSLAAVGVALEAEGLRTNIIGLDGDEFQAILGSIFQDAGMLCGWDRISGKYIFSLLRDPSALPSIAHVPQQLLSNPLPERFSQLQSDALHDKAFFGFPDTDLSYRDNIIVDSNDSLASIDQNQKGTVVQMPTVIDSQMAAKVADRRSPEVLTALAKSQVTVLRDAADLYPGQYCTIYDFDSTQIVLEVQAKAKSRQTVIQVATDSYSITPSSAPLTAYITPPDPVEPVADIAVTLIELPEALRLASRRAIGVLRIRKNSTIADAGVHISSDDLTFTRIRDGSQFVTGILLSQGMDNNPLELLLGPYGVGLGPDVTTLSQTLSTENRDLGRQLLIVDDEIMFVKEIEPLGDDFYRPKGILRGQYGTSVVTHAQGAVAYIVDPRRLEAIYDPSVQSLADVYVKTQPRTSNTEISLATVTSVTRSILGAPPVPITEYFAEVPSGAINGVNGIFTLIAGPSPAGSLILVKNGLDQRGAGEDYDVSGNTITFSAGNIPQTGDTVVARRYLSL